MTSAAGAPTGEGLDNSDVLIIGTGLIGASVGLALAASGLRTWLLDSDPGAESVAMRLGAGTSWPGERPSRDDDDSDDIGPALRLRQPRHVIVAVPPAQVASVLSWVSRTYVSATMSDVASVKASPAAEAETVGTDMTRYVGGHPVAGRETSGAGGARADLFTDRPWAVCPGPTSSPDAVRDATEVAVRCGARVVVVSPDDHDRVLARLSHVPQLVASALASAIDVVSAAEIGLVGQGFRDTTRVADSDPMLWGGIVAANAGPVADGLRAVAARLLTVADALMGAPGPGGETPGRGGVTPGASAAEPASTFAEQAGRDRGARAVGAGSTSGVKAVTARQVVVDLVAAGRAQRGRLPGKAAVRPTSRVTLVLPDAPGALVRVLSVAAAAEVNVEDLRLEHSPSREAGVVELLVPLGRADDLVVALRAQGWSAHRVE